MILHDLMPSFFQRPPPSFGYFQICTSSLLCWFAILTVPHSPRLLSVVQSTFEAYFITNSSITYAPSIWGRVIVDRRLPSILWKMMFRIISMELGVVCRTSLGPTSKNLGPSIESNTIYHVCDIRFIFGANEILWPFPKRPNILDGHITDDV